MRKIFQALCQIFSEILGLSMDAVTPDTALTGLKYQELAAAAIACEKTFRIEMEDERVGEMVTVEQWVDYIRERITEKNDGAAPASDEERESWYYQ